MSAGHEVTELLVKWATGNQQALGELTPLVYAKLRRLAAAYLRRERPDHTLQPTALVHEAYLRLVDQRNLSWQSRSHFFRVAAHLMREIPVDHARRRKAGKRAGHNVPLEETVSFGLERSANLIAVDDALGALARLDGRKCPGRRASLFRRAQHGGNRGDPRCFAGDGPSRFEHGGVLAISRNAEWRDWA